MNEGSRGTRERAIQVGDVRDAVDRRAVLALADVFWCMHHQAFYHGQRSILHRGEFWIHLECECRRLALYPYEEGAE